MAGTRPWSRLIGALVALLGLVCAGSGLVVWSLVAGSLRDEHVRVGPDAPALVGSQVDTPWEAWAQAQALARQQAGATGGATVSQLPVGDPNRQAVLESTTLRAALYDAVTGFGLAALSILVGVALVLLAVGLLLGGRVRTAEPVTGRSRRPSR
jgi:hypothetical protein